MKTEGEVSIGVEFTAVQGVDQAMRRAYGAMKQTPPSVTMARWPNELGETPGDAIGKTVRLEFGGHATEYIVDHVYGEALILRHSA